jgi:hypothetical protein
VFGFEELIPYPICVITSLFKKGLSENLLRKGFIENDKSIFEFKILSPNPIGVITSLFKKGLSENYC